MFHYSSSYFKFNFFLVLSTNPCALGRAELYYPDPRDDTRYIQCSQWGQSYVKSCGVDKVWNNSLKTCVQRRASGTESKFKNQIYTTGPSGYQMASARYDDDRSNYEYQYIYENSNNNQNNGENQYLQRGQEQYYIDANNTVGVSYSSAYSMSNPPSYQPHVIQNDLPSDYDTPTWTSDTQTHSGKVSGYADQNSLWNTFAHSLQNPNFDTRRQNSRIYGQTKSGKTNPQQSGTLYGRSKDQANSYSWSDQPAEGNTLWNRYARSLTGNSNSAAQLSSAQRNIYNQGTASTDSPTSNFGGSCSNSIYQVNTAYLNAISPDSAYSSNTNSMGNSQRETPSVAQSRHTASVLSSLDVPELCRDADIRYIAAQNDYHHFYECIKGSAQIKTCPEGEFWVHPLRKCVDLNDKNNKIASHNPCIGSDLRFHPYPADPSKYVECQSWYRVYVWRCNDGLWTQNRQQCSSGIPTNGMGNNENVHVVQYFKDHCDSTTFYYAHENPAKYVQCDEFGNWFIKDCALNTTWDDSLKSCVRHFSSSGPANKDTNTMSRVSRQLPNNFDGKLSSYPCPAKYSWDVSVNKCVAISQSDYLPTCARGYMWDSSLNKCVLYVDPSTVEEFPDIEYARPNCRLGHRWDQQLQMCVQDTLGSHADTEYSNFLFEIDLGGTDFYDNQQGRDYTLVHNSIHSPTGDDLDLLPNICDTSSDRYYYPYPGKPSLFIQCDQLGVMHAQVCGSNSIWNDDIMTCVPRGYFEESNTNKITENSHVLGNVCNDTDTAYHPYSANKKMFIMCVHGIANMMSCPYGSIWEDDITACGWPEKNGN